MAAIARTQPDQRMPLPERAGHARMSRISAMLGLSLAVLMPREAQAQARQDTIPFVGCPADGQTGYIAPPRGSPKVVALQGVPAEAIAYYQGDAGPGAFAPRGWHCQVTYGSAGSTIVVTPDSVNLAQYPELKVPGHAVEMELRFAGTSGRFSVAAYASRLFPTVVPEFIERVRSEGLVPDSELTGRRYAQDSVRSLGRLVAEFVTPAGRRGLGTAGYLDPSPDVIRGVAAIAADPEEPDMSVLRVRLGVRLHLLEAAVLQLNRECMQRREGCR